MLNFSRAKTALIFGVCVIGILLSVPSFMKPGSLPSWLPQPRINLGLDLQGGSYLLLDVDLDAVMKEKLASMQADIARTLRSAGIRSGGVSTRDKTIVVDFNSVEDLQRGRDALKELVGASTDGRRAARIFDENINGTRLTISFSMPGLTELATKTAEQSISIVRRRIDETGVNEPVVARQGQGRILVELPGVSDPDRIKRLLGSTARMTFRLVAPEGTPAGADVEILPLVDRGQGAGRRIPVYRHIEIDGSNLTQATATRDQRGGGWVVDFALDGIGTKRFADVSTRHVGEPFAIVLDNKVISAPVIREPILGGRGQISGSFTVEDANDLAVLLRAGALPAPLHVVEERTVGPSLGADAIKAGMYSIAAGFLLVVTFIVLLYGRFGIYAVIALIANLALTLTGLALLNATLTLPGIAGLLLALGMAVDANILVNERIREEVKRGKGVVTPIETGFKRAFSTILDANVTTLIKMLVLFAIGVGAIRGFAITISLGILISMFTALVLVRLLISIWIKRTRPKSLKVGTRWHLLPENTNIHFMRARYSGLAVSAFISATSLILAYSPGLKMGVDFTGGIVVEARTQGPADQAALRAGLGSIGLGPVQVQQFGGPEDILLRFEQPSAGEGAQQDAVNKIRAEVAQVAPGAEIRRVEVVGPALGSELLKDGLLALAIASIAMLIYIAWRFEWPFAIGAVLTMLLDLTKTVGFLALTGFEFNLAMIAAILTIMGFSINDKVVVYDRIRENLSKYRRMALSDLINLSINETLSRTVGTSFALLLAIAPLAIFGGPALREFAFTLLFGLWLATSSSIFIAAPILLNIGEARLRMGSKGPVGAQPKAG